MREYELDMVGSDQLEDPVAILPFEECLEFEPETDMHSILEVCVLLMQKKIEFIQDKMRKLVNESIGKLRYATYKLMPLTGNNTKPLRR